MRNESQAVSGGDLEGGSIFRLRECGEEFPVAVRFPAGPKPSHEADFDARKIVSEPFRDGFPAALEVSWHEEVPHNQIRVLRGPEQVLLDDFEVAIDACKAGGARMVSKFEVGYPAVKEPGEEVSSLSGGVCVGFPHQAGVFR